jgi:hypothetical protein
MREDIVFLRRKNYELKNENLQLKSEVAYLKGKIGAYEWFLRRQGFIKGGEDE